MFTAVYRHIYKLRINKKSNYLLLKIIVLLITISFYENKSNNCKQNTIVIDYGPHHDHHFML